MPSSRTSKDANRLLKLADGLGWTAEAPQGQRIKLTHPDASEPLYLRETLRGGHGHVVKNIEAALRRPHQNATAASVDTPPVPKAPVRKTASTTIQSREEVSVKPFTAKHSMTDSGGDVYDSGAVLEVTYSDGNIDYRCSQCEYTNAKPRSVASHFGGKHGVKGGAAKQMKATGRIDPNEVWTPNRVQDAAIRRLAAEIERAMADGASDPTAIATAVVEARATRGEAETFEPIPALSSEQILAKIRLLLDDGSVQRLTLEAEEKDAALAAEQEVSEQLRTDLESAQHRLNSFRASAIAASEIVREMAIEEV